MSCPYHGSVAYCCGHKRAPEISLKGCLAVLACVALYLGFVALCVWGMS